MKKVRLIVVTALIAALCVPLCACGRSNAPVVGSYRLYSVYMDNGTTQASYSVLDANPVVNENSFVLEIKSNYKWTMSIMLPGVTETEDGKWTDENGVYALHEDDDDPVIYLTLDGDILKFNMSEDGYVMNVTLTKIAKQA